MATYKVTFNVDEEKVRDVAPTEEILSVKEGVDLLFFFMQFGDIAKLVTYEKVTNEGIDKALHILYGLEDKTGYENENISNAINWLQKELKPMERKEIRAGISDHNPIEEEEIPF